MLLLPLSLWLAAVLVLLAVEVAVPLGCPAAAPVIICVDVSVPLEASDTGMPEAVK